MSRCRNHPDEIECPVKMGQDAQDVILQCKTGREAGVVAVEVMRMMLKLSGGRAGGKQFAGVVAGAAKVMP